jgi:hypothetical protein
MIRNTRRRFDVDSNKTAVGLQKAALLLAPARLCWRPSAYCPAENEQTTREPTRETAAAVSVLPSRTS